MVIIPKLSEVGTRIENDALRAHYLQSTEAGLDVLNDALREPQYLTTEEIQYFATVRLLWERALDESYSPPVRDHGTNVFPLWVRSKTYKQRGQPAEALKAAWRFVQYCPVGSIWLQSALNELMEQAVDEDNMLLACSLAKMYLAHYMLLKTATKSHLTPICDSEPNQDDLASVNVGTLVVLPVYVAVRGMQIQPEECWVRLLELVVYEVPQENLNLHVLDNARTTLQTYYTNVGDQKSLERLNGLLAQLSLDLFPYEGS